MREHRKIEKNVFSCKKIMVNEVALWLCLRIISKLLRDGGAKTMYMFLIGSLRPKQFDFWSSFFAPKKFVRITSAQN